MRTFAAILALILAAAAWQPLFSGADDAETMPFSTRIEQDDVKDAMKSAFAKYRTLNEGANADYIPALAKVDPGIFGIVLVTTDGRAYSIGDVRSEVSIQSISKVFTAALVMKEQGPGALFDNMGVDATGQVFNSIVAIEQYKGAQMNPLVNAGAIAATSMVSGDSYDAIWGKIRSCYNAFAARELTLNEEVFRSEADTNQRNQAIAMLMYAYGRIQQDPLQACDIYTRQCSLNVNAKDLAVMAATLANGGKNPLTKEQVMPNQHVPELLAIMATAGLYDDAGQWLYMTGLPAKSGVGGGILAVSPGKFGIAAISPPLDAAGNSIRARRAITDISNALGGNPYAVTPR